MRRWLWLWVALCVGFGSSSLAADDADLTSLPFELETDAQGSMDYDFRRQLYVARGGPGGRVRVRQHGRKLEADWVAYSRDTRRGVASGDVQISDGAETLRAQFVEFDVDTLEGVMFEAEFVGQRTPLELRGAEVAKTGERSYRFRDGRFTACRCPDPEAREPWQVTAEEAELEIEGYGTARNTSFEVFGVPVLWLPWMLYPLKTERQSGLLFPELAFSGRNGAEVGLPIFWAAGDPVNVTFTPRWLQKRGAKGDLDLEYVFGERSAGRFFGAGLYDDDVDTDTRRTPFGKGRWATHGSHDLFLPGGVRVKSRYAFASDNAYPNDFDDLEDYRHERFLPAESFAFRHAGGAGRFGAVAGAQHLDDLQNPDDTDRDEFLLNRLPNAQLHALPAPLPFADFLVPALDVRYAWYQQHELPQDVYGAARLVATNGRFLDSGIDGLPSMGVNVEQGLGPVGDPNGDDFAAGNPLGTEGDGIFQEGELLADEGHRVVLTPRLGVPLRIADVIEVYPEVGWHETLYQSRAQGSERRGMLTGRVEARMRLRGEIAGALHLFEPRVGWAIVDAPHQRDDPLFVPATAVPQTRVRDLELENVTRDWADRIADFHAVTFGFVNRLYARGSGGAGARLLADFVIQGLYDIERSRIGTIFLDGRAYPFEGAWTRFGVGFDAHAGNLDEALLRVGWSDPRGDALELGYRFLREVPRFFEDFPSANRRFDGFNAEFDRVNQLDGGVRVAITANWAVGYRAVYSFERNLLIGNRGFVEYTSRCLCWAVALEVRESRGRGVAFGLRYRLTGLGDDARRRPRAGAEPAAGSLDAFGGV